MLTLSNRAIRPRLSTAMLTSLAVLAGAGTVAQAEEAPVSASPAPAPGASPSALDLQLQKALQADQATQAQAQAPAPAPRGFMGIQSFNPDLSVIGDFALAAFRGTNPTGILTLQPGGHDPENNGFNLQAVEIALGATIDPYMRFDANLAFAPDPTSSIGVNFELEEAYATTLSLPANLQIRAGQFLNRFGRLNPQHPHTWDFADEPYVLFKFFGPDGNRGPAAEVSELMSFLPWYAEVVFSGMSPLGEDARSFLGGTTASSGATLEGVRQAAVRTGQDILYMAALKQFFPLADNWSLAWGLSSLFGPNVYGPNARAYVYGTDLYLKYRPVDEASYTIVSLTAEAMYRHRDGMTVPGAVSVADDYGGYAQLFWRFAQRWGIAGRFDMATGVRNDPDPDDALWTKPRYRTSVALTFWPSEFSRLRLQANDVVALDQSQNVQSLFLTVEFAAGAHGAHAF
jgi:hypothetical protein